MTDEILEQRLRTEAERRAETVEVTRRAMLDLGLQAARDRREREARAAALEADVLLVTATLTEFRQLREAALALGLPFERRSGAFRPYHHLGQIGTTRVSSVQVPSMGAFGARGSAASCIQARSETRATTLILVGTAFGVRPDQRVGDVLVSEFVFLYDDRRVVDDESSSRGYLLDYRTACRPASVAWAQRFRGLAAEYDQAGETERVMVGTLLSGGALIESARFRDELLHTLPAMESPVIGGEMEAAGAIAASAGDSDEPGWIVVKAISDFAEAASRSDDELEKSRCHAARSAARAVLRVLLSF